MTGVVLVPTRDRPQAAVELREAFAATNAFGYADLKFLVDDDDPQLDEYLGRLSGVTVGPRLRIGPTLNEAARQQAVKYEWIGFMGDDHRPRTNGWAEGINTLLARLPGVAYGDDLIQGAALPTAAFISSSLIRKLGYMVPRGLLHMYLDNFWRELGAATQLHYLPHLVFEHLHPLVGKTAWTPQYDEVNALMGQDSAEFHRFMRDEWPLERLKLL